MGRADQYAFILPLEKNNRYCLREEHEELMSELVLDKECVSTAGKTAR